MSSLASLLVVSALSAAGGQAVPAAQPPSSEPASLSFVSNVQALAGIAYGIDAIDAQPSFFEQRVSANVSAGRRTVSFSCPDTPQMTGGSHLTFDFVAGRHYELVCEPAKDAVIRPADEC